ncbi:MAG: DUF1549 domain-containing protein, partial [Bryobacteraceae bacterium]|nr:DUF1549 domain-containing protein [Bryobacteraceae bacterium]
MLSKACIVGLALGMMPAAADPNAEAVAILGRRCASCHNEKVTMSGLRVGSRDALLKGGSRGAAIQPGNSAQSLLVKALSHADKLAMPPTGKLPATEIAALSKWIDSGAGWAHTASANASWWAFRPPARPAVPSGGSTPIDAFIQAMLREKALPSAPEADRATLIRRVTFDLHGLPPTAADILAFQQDSRPDAYALLLDRLLASPRYGEKWGKHWLDLVRYGDTSGFEQDPYQLYSWRYRDYVIKSFNEDKPYDRFVREQIAGDEIYPEDPQAQQGTGYFTVGPNRDMLYKVEDINRVESLTDFVDTTSSVFLGLSVGCARCHDHKYDPISQQEFFQLYAYFNSIDEPGLYSQEPDPTRAFEPFLAVPSPAQRERLTAIGERLSAAKSAASTVS